MHYIILPERSFMEVICMEDILGKINKVLTNTRLILGIAFVIVLIIFIIVGFSQVLGM